MKRLLFIFAAAASVVALAAGNELAVARQALRDGLWDVARMNAEKAAGDEARLVTLESWAREGGWDKVLKCLGEWGNPTNGAFVCYRAAALAKTGKAAEAKGILEGRVFADPSQASFARRVRAEIMAAAGDREGALKLLKSGPLDTTDDRMLAADLESAGGNSAAARELWQAVAKNVAAGVDARARAAAMTDDAATLETIFRSASGAATTRYAGLRLGRIRLRDEKTFDEGAKIVRGIVRDAPDAEGASDAFVALADALLARRDFAAALAAYVQACETWPAVAKGAAVWEGRGWALAELSRNSEALEAFRRAEEFATDDETRATAAVKVGDMLAATGDAKGAVAKYRDAVAKYPKTRSGALAQGLLKLRELEDGGRADYAAYRFAAAQKAFAAVAAAAPSEADRMSLFIVRCLYGQGLDDEAGRLAQKLSDAAKSPEVRAGATLWLAKFSYNRRQWKTSAALFVRYADMVSDAPDAADALVWSARAAFSEGDFAAAVQTVARLTARYPESKARTEGMFVQAESLVELARFDEAVLVLDRMMLDAAMPSAERVRALTLKGDALFAMGADNSARYEAALETYRAVRLIEKPSSTGQLEIAFKIGKTLEKLKRQDEARDQYYSQVLLAYREGREKGVAYDEAARVAFSRAGFRLADDYESRGQDFQAVQVLRLVATSDVPAASEAERRIERIERKGKIL